LLDSQELKVESQSEQDCVAEIKNLLCSKAQIYCAVVQNAKHWVKCYVQNAETLCSKYRLNAEIPCLKYRWYAQNTEMLIYIMLKSRDIHTYSNSSGTLQNTQSSG